MNHVLHLMLMGLGREGSISIAYLSTFPYTARLRVRLAMSGPWPVQVRLCPAPAERSCRTMHSMHYGVTSVPVLHPCARHRFGVELDIST